MADVQVHYYVRKIQGFEGVGDILVVAFGCGFACREIRVDDNERKGFGFEDEGEGCGWITRNDFGDG